MKVAREKFIPQLEKVTGRISVVAPKGLSLTVDGEPAGLAPLADPVDVLPGRHVVVASGPSGSSTAEIEVLAGQAASVTVGDGGENASTNVAGAPRRTASECSTIMSIVAGIVFG